MLDKHSCEMFYTQKLPSKVSQGDTKMRVDLHHGMYGVLASICANYARRRLSVLAASWCPTICVKG